MVHERVFNCLEHRQSTLDKKINLIKENFQTLKKTNINYNNTIPVIKICYLLELIERIKQING